MGDDIKTLLATIITQNNEIKEDISEIKVELQTQRENFESANEKIAELERENNELRAKLANVEKRLKRDNIIIFGIKEDILNLQDYVVELINTTLNVPLSHTEIRNIHRIGKKTTEKVRPIILEFVSLLKKQQTLRSAVKLKGSGITFANDLTTEEREENKFLYSQFKIAREKQYDVKILKKALVICGTSYKSEDLKAYGIDNLINKDNSAYTEEDSSDLRTKKTNLPNNFGEKKANLPEGSKQAERDLRSASRRLKH